MNLDTDFLKFETDGTFSYYAYTNSRIIPSDSESKWSIRRVSDNVNINNVEWSNNRKFHFTSIWNDKEFYFEDPGIYASGWSGNGVTWSSSILNTSFGDVNVLNIGISDIPGVDIYKINLIDEKGNKLNNKGDIIYNFDRNSDEIFSNNDPIEPYSLELTFRNLQSGLTYSLSVLASNSKGSIEFSDYILI
jgi:hypothetical protein